MILALVGSTRKNAESKCCVIVTPVSDPKISALGQKWPLWCPKTLIFQALAYTLTHVVILGFNMPKRRSSKGNVCVVISDCIIF